MCLQYLHFPMKIHNYPTKTLHYFFFSNRSQNTKNLRKIENTSAKIWKNIGYVIQPVKENEYTNDSYLYRYRNLQTRKEFRTSVVRLCVIKDIGNPLKTTLDLSS